MDLKYTVTVFFVSALACLTTSVSSVCPSNVTSVPCGHPNVSEVQCLNSGCCWNVSSGATPTRCYGIANNHSVVNSTVAMTTVKTPSTKVNQSTIAGGTCQVYRARVCERWLNYTMLEYRWTPRYIDYRFGLNKTEGLVLEFMKVIGRINGQSRCKDILRALLCEYFLPPCNEENKPYNFCREDCEAAFETCHTAVMELLGAAKYFKEELGELLGHAGVPNCTEHHYSSYYKVKNSTCVHFGLFTFPPPPTTAKDKGKETLSKFNVAVIAGAAAGIVTLVVFVVIIAIVTKRQAKVVSIRNRVQVEAKHRASEDDKIASLFKPDDVKQIPLTRIEYIRDLGSWNFGSVFLGRAHGLIKGKDDAGIKVTVKTLAKESSIDTKENFIEKLALISLLHHENILELLAVSTEEEPYAMIFEFMELGDLTQFLRRAGPCFEGDEKERVYLTQDDLVSFSIQCAAGMEHLQRLKFVHRDVSSRNCLVGHGFTVKIADLGMARHIYVSDYHKVEGRGLLPVRWMAPEALFSGKFSLESDVYSFGVLLWEIFTLALQPYYGYSDEEVIKFIEE
ncbi:inactive tyrosine-protein kinase transmembrane receptor ROR1-like, partial [Stylophora pistillata]|uniref:inactive tyrosine-protein kinase transmembrane receptor ROR1-like n=1 Tax=Stylophora pistillata TaxID=50429 RepID=UPI000C03AF1C